MPIEVKQPDDTIELRIGEGTKEFFMSAALVRTLVSVVGTGEQFAEMLTSPDLQSQLMAFVLCPRDEKGRAQEDFYLDGVKISTSEGKRLLKWIEDHVLYFFIDSAETAKQSMEGPAIQKLMELLNGLRASLPEMPSAGPSTADPATT